MANAPLQLYEITVPREWVDYNGHMNDAAYATVFSHATDRLMTRIGLDPATRDEAGTTIYTLENHICYLLEAKQGEPLRVTMQLLEHDSKRLRPFYVLYRADETEALATSEQMLMHIDKSGPKAAPFADDVMQQIKALAQQHANLPMPKQAGRSIKTLAKKTQANSPKTGQ